MGELSALLPAADFFLIGIGGAVITYLVKIEHRLTKIETILEN